MRRPLLVISATCVLLVLATTALASHPPSPEARARMHAAVARSALMPTPIRNGHFRLTAALVSSVGPWAKATVVPTGAAKNELDRVLTIFRRHHRGWRVVSLGTSGVGCSLPRKVRRDLDLSCPGRPAASLRN